jgi:hypothetical protein
MWGVRHYTECEVYGIIPNVRCTALYRMWGVRPYTECEVYDIIPNNIGYTHLRRLREFENRVLRRIFEPKRDEVTEEWSKLHNEELNNLYSSPNIVRVIRSRKIRSAGHVARMGKRRGVYRGLVEKTESKRPLGRPRRRWENNMTMGLQEVGVGAWTRSSWLRIGTGGGHS